MTNEQKIDKTLEAVSEIKESMAKMLAHQEQHRVELDKHSLKIEILDAMKNKTLGFVSLLGMIFGTIVGWLLHLVSK